MRKCKKKEIISTYTKVKHEINDRTPAFKTGYQIQKARQIFLLNTHEKASLAFLFANEFKSNSET